MKSFSQPKNQQNKFSASSKPTIVYTYTSISSEDSNQKWRSRHILSLILMGSGLAILLGTLFGFFPCSTTQQNQQQIIPHAQEK